MIWRSVCGLCGRMFIRMDGAEKHLRESTCALFVFELRPIEWDSIDPMINKRKNTRILTTLCALIVLLIGALVVTTTAEANTRPPAPPGTPIACNRAWYVAPVGSKYAAMQRCLRGYCARPRLVPRTVTVKGERVDRNQRHVLGWIVNEARDRKLPVVVTVSAIATTTQEASAHELEGGHGTSAGPFQLIDAHGPLRLRRTVEFSGNWYYNGAMKVHYRGISPVALSHRVQRSAHPTAVAQWIPEAHKSLKKILGPCSYTTTKRKP